MEGYIGGWLGLDWFWGVNYGKMKRISILCFHVVCLYLK